MAQGLDAKASCIAATTANITLSGAQTIDGIAVVAGNRVLVKDQTLSQFNGIYLCAAGAWTRTTDADTFAELVSAFTFVETGTVNADKGFVCTVDAGGTLGTTPLPFVQFSSAGSFTAGTGLTLTGSVFSLTTPVAVANGGTGVATSTGTGSVVLSTSPTLVTPALGVASATSLTTTGTINLLTVGQGAGAISSNTAVGGDALSVNAAGTFNTAVGKGALQANTSGLNNTAVGSFSLTSNIDGFENTALGSDALDQNTTGDRNTSVGAFSGQSSSSDNTSIGARSQATASGVTTFNTSVGSLSLQSLAFGNNNTAVGYNALNKVSGTTGTEGYSNTAIGVSAGSLITTGAKNTIIGGFSGNQGGLDIRTASNHIVLSDGDGNPRGQFNASGVFSAPAGMTNTPFNGTVGATTPSTGAFTSVTASTPIGTASGGTGLGGATPFIANGVVYASSTSALATNSALTWNGTNLFSTGSITLDTNLGIFFSGTGVTSAGVYGRASGTEIAFNASGAEKLRLTSTSLYTASDVNVGFGTSTPGVKLHVNSSGSEVSRFQTSGADMYLRFVNSFDVNGYIGYQNAALTFWTANNLRATIDSVGKLSLSLANGQMGFASGNTASGVKIQAFNAAGNADGYLAFEGFTKEYGRFDSAGKLSIGTFGDTGRKLEVLGSEALLDGAGQFDLIIGDGGVAYMSLTTTDNATALKIRNYSGNSDIAVFERTTGNVGLGTSTPAAKLSVAGNMETVAAANRYVKASGWISNQVGQNSDFGASDVGLVAKTGTNLCFITGNGSTGNGLERARIDSSGNFMVGTETRGSANALTAFDLDVTDGNLYITHATGTPTGYYYVSFGYGASNVIGSITQSGTTAVLYNTTSDYRLKTVIGPVADAGQRIDALQPVEYTWNSNGERTRGFLAHQFQEVYAGSVSGTKDAVDAEGKPVYQSMQASTSEVIADLVAELKSLRARVAALESSTLQ